MLRSKGGGGELKRSQRLNVLYLCSDKKHKSKQKKSCVTLSFSFNEGDEEEEEEDEDSKLFHYLIY